MKYIYPALLLLFMASCQKEPKIDHSKTDWEFFKLKGNVENISEKSYQLVNGQKGGLKRELDHDYDLHFNEEGKLTLEKKWIQDKPFEENTYNGQTNMLSSTQFMSGQPVIKTEYQWDKTGKNNTNIIKRNPDNSQLSREEKIYTKGLLTQKNLYDLQDILTEKTTYEYDEKKNMVKENKFLREETVQYITSFEYDEKNRKKLESSYKANGDLIYKTIFDYDGDNLAGVETINGADNTTAKIEKFTYNDKGKVLTETSYNSFDKTNSVDEYTYDEKGNQTSRSNSKDGNIMGKVAFTYDDKNNQTSINVVDGAGTTLESKSYTFEYDAHGNWVKKTIKINDKPAFIVERKITYYD